MPVSEVASRTSDPLQPTGADAFAVATLDQRPFFEKAIKFGQEQGVLLPADIQAIVAGAPKGIVQIANFFGTAHLRDNLEIARVRMVNLVSLYLEQASDNNLLAAARLLKEKSVLSLSKGGSDLLKMLHAMAEVAILGDEAHHNDSQKNYLNEKTFAQPMTLKSYMAEKASREQIQLQLATASFLAGKLGIKSRELNGVHADSLIKSALLIIFVKDAKLEIPGKAGFARLIKAAQAKTASLEVKRLDNLLASASFDIQARIRQEMEAFISTDLPKIRAASSRIDMLLDPDGEQGFYINEDALEEIGEFDKMTAKEWYRVTKGEADDPSVLATLFLFIATGLPPKATALLKEAKEVIRIFRSSGFDSNAVMAYIEKHAPYSSQEELKRLWLEDLQPDAETHLADKDPRYPDSYMERSLKYYKENCKTTWKGKA